MQHCPFKHETLRPGREITSHLAGFNLYCHRVLTVHGVEVCEAVFAEEHADDVPRNREISGMSPDKGAAPPTQ